MDQNSLNDTESTQVTQPTPVQPVVEAPAVPAPSLFQLIQRITAWVMIISAVAFAIVGILAIWQVFGEDASDIVWRALSSLAVIAFAALIINVSVRMVEDHRK